MHRKTRFLLSSTLSGAFLVIFATQSANAVTEVSPRREHLREQYQEPSINPNINQQSRLRFPKSCEYLNREMVIDFGINMERIDPEMIVDSGINLEKIDPGMIIPCPKSSNFNHQEIDDKYRK
jgi:hypothetical protein